VAKGVQKALEGAGDAGHPARVAVGGGLADPRGVEADDLETPCHHFGFERFRQLQARPDAGDQQQRITGAAHPDPEPDTVDLDEALGAVGLVASAPGSVR
jgi:hypothetical protein